MSGALVPGDQTIVGNLTVAGEIVGFGNKVATDGNGDLRVAHKRVSFALSSGKGVGLSKIRDEVEEQGEASVEGGTDQAQISLETVGPGGLARLSTAQKGRCDVGRTVEVGVALRLSHADFSEGQVARWGYFDDKDGFMFVMDGSGLGVAVRHGGDEEDPVQLYRRSDWNVDKLDGQGPSGVSFDPTSGAAMYQVMFTWGVKSAIVFRVVLTSSEGNQFVQIVHRIEAESLSGEKNHAVQRFVLPIRAEIEWLPSSSDDHPERSAHVTGRYFSIIGGSAEEVRWGTSTPPRLTTAYSVAKRFSLMAQGTDDGFVPLLSVRRKSDYEDDGGRVELSDMDIVFDSIFADVLFVLLQVRLDAVLGGEGSSWNKLPHVLPDETALEQDTKATELEGGIVVYSSLIMAGTNESRKTTLVSDVAVPDGRHSVTVCIKPLNVIGESSSITGGASCLLRLKEGW